MGKTKIEWATDSWNPLRARLKADPAKVGWHCEHDSEGCRFCYAESMNKRLGTGLDFKPGHRPSIELFLDEKMLLAPISWKKPRMIFVCSMTDLFADFVPDEWIDALFAVMMLCPQHTFQVLTKRMARARAYCSDPATVKRISDKVCDMATERGVNAVLIAPGINPELAPKGARVFLGRWPLLNVWAGTSCEDQENADARIPDLLATPAAVRFVSAEPLIGPIEFADIEGALGLLKVRIPKNVAPLHKFDPNTTRLGDAITGLGGSIERVRGLDWIIVGGESGAKARPMHPDWARDIRDQCAAANVPFFFKQWGEWAPLIASDGLRTEGAGSHGAVFEGSRAITFPRGERHGEVFRVGKKAAGRLLDGREHNEMPQRPPTLVGNRAELFNQVRSRPLETDGA